MNHATARPAGAADEAAAIERGFVGPIRDLLDRAHAELPTPELAALLLAVHEAADAPEGAARASRGLSPRVAAAYAPIQQLLGLAAGRAEDHYARIGDLLRDHLHEVAARPRGAAVQAAFAA